LPRHYKRKKKRFPKFFEDALGPMVSLDVPGELRPDEREMLDPDARLSDAVQLPPDLPTWALLPDEEPSGFVTEIDVLFAEDVHAGAGGDEGPSPQ
jgi:hypothetical protein